MVVQTSTLALAWPAKHDACRRVGNVVQLLVPIRTKAGVLVWRMVRFISCLCSLSFHIHSVVVVVS